MTLAQVRAALAAEARRERRRRRDWLFLLRAAQATEEGFREAWEQLQDDPP